MDTEKKRIYYSLLFPAILVASMWLLKIIEITFHWNLAFLGILPLHKSGLTGILTSPFIHENWSHLMANSGPLIILGAVVFYFYRDIAFRVFGLIWLLTGLWVWCMAREAYHIGASGVVYGLATFVFTSGLLRRDNRLLALSLLVVFLYGSLIWGIFPQLFPEKNISWESHLMGIVAGIVVAVYYRKYGPTRKVYDWGDEDDDDEVPEWYPETSQPPPPQSQHADIQEENKEENPPVEPPSINYIFREKKKS